MPDNWNGRFYFQGGGGTDGSVRPAIGSGGSAPHHSYLVGCSNGGRQGMIASQRFPDLFDGIIAGAPVFRMSRSHVDTAWGLQKLSSIAPKDDSDSGAPILSRAFSDADLALLSEWFWRSDSVNTTPRVCNVRAKMPTAA